MIAALAMRKLQALHLLSTPGVMTTTDVVITIVQDLDRALIQAPNMHLKLLAAATDWDAAFEELNLDDGEDRSDIADADGDTGAEIEAGLEADLPPDLASLADDPTSSRQDHPAHRADLDGAGFEILDASQADPATERFRLLHGKLHDAAYAVIELSEGEIRYLI
jgi:ParB-like chromosome segregation protein Spo0J